MNNKDAVLETLKKTSEILYGPDKGVFNPNDWMRLPKPGTFLAGISRSTFTELIAARKIKAIKIINDGKDRGITLIYKPSIQAYFHSLMT